MAFTDPILAAFVAASDGHAVVNEANWRHFVETLRSDGLLTSERELRFLDDFWRSTSNDHVELRNTRMTYSALRQHLSKALFTHTETTDTVYTSLEMLRAGTAQLQTLTQIDQPDPRVLRDLLRRCAKADAALSLCEANLVDFIKRAASDLDVERVLKLTQSNMVDDAHTSCVDPYRWQSEHIIDIERHASYRRVISLSHIRYTKRDCTGKDPRARSVHVLAAGGACCAHRMLRLIGGLWPKVWSPSAKDSPFARLR